MARLFKAALCLACLLVFHVADSAADASIEYKVKAVCVLNAARFVDWPNDAFADGNAPVVIGVLGENPFGPLLQQAIAGELVKNRKLVLKSFARGEPLTGCHVLFV